MSPSSSSVLLQIITLRVIFLITILASSSLSPLMISAQTAPQLPSVGFFENVPCPPNGQMIIENGIHNASVDKADFTISNCQIVVRNVVIETTIKVPALDGCSITFEDITTTTTMSSGSTTLAPVQLILFDQPLNNTGSIIFRRITRIGDEVFTDRDSSAKAVSIVSFDSAALIVNSMMEELIVEDIIMSNILRWIDVATPIRKATIEVISFEETFYVRKRLIVRNVQMKNNRVRGNGAYCRAFVASMIRAPSAAPGWSLESDPTYTSPTILFENILMENNYVESTGSFDGQVSIVQIESFDGFKQVTFRNLANRDATAVAGDESDSLASILAVSIWQTNDAVKGVPLSRGLYSDTAQSSLIVENVVLERLTLLANRSNDRAARVVACNFNVVSSFSDFNSVLLKNLVIRGVFAALGAASRNVLIRSAIFQKTVDAPFTDDESVFVLRNSTFQQVDCVVEDISAYSPRFFSRNEFAELRVTGILFERSVTNWQNMIFTNNNINRIRLVDPDAEDGDIEQGQRLAVDATVLAFGQSSVVKLVGNSVSNGSLIVDNIRVTDVLVRHRMTGSGLASRVHGVRFAGLVEGYARITISNVIVDNVDLDLGHVLNNAVTGNREVVSLNVHCIKFGKSLQLSVALPRGIPSEIPLLPRGHLTIVDNSLSNIRLAITSHLVAISLFDIYGGIGSYQQINFHQNHMNNINIENTVVYTYPVDASSFQLESLAVVNLRRENDEDIISSLYGGNTVFDVASTDPGFERAFVINSISLNNVYIDKQLLKSQRGGARVGSVVAISAVAIQHQIIAYDVVMMTNLEVKNITAISNLTESLSSGGSRAQPVSISTLTNERAISATSFSAESRNAANRRRLFLVSNISLLNLKRGLALAPAVGTQRDIVDSVVYFETTVLSNFLDVVFENIHGFSSSVYEAYGGNVILCAVYLQFAQISVASSQDVLGANASQKVEQSRLLFQNLTIENVKVGYSGVRVSGLDATAKTGAVTFGDFATIWFKNIRTSDIHVDLFGVGDKITNVNGQKSRDCTMQMVRIDLDSISFMKYLAFEQLTLQNINIFIHSAEEEQKQNNFFDILTLVGNENSRVSPSSSASSSSPPSILLQNFILKNIWVSSPSFSNSGLINAYVRGTSLMTSFVNRNLPFEIICIGFNFENITFGFPHMYRSFTSNSERDPFHVDFSLVNMYSGGRQRTLANVQSFVVSDCIVKDVTVFIQKTANTGSNTNPFATTPPHNFVNKLRGNLWLRFLTIDYQVENVGQFLVTNGSISEINRNGDGITVQLHVVDVLPKSPIYTGTRARDFLCDRVEVSNFHLSSTTTRNLLLGNKQQLIRTLLPLASLSEKDSLYGFTPTLCGVHAGFIKMQYRLPPGTTVGDNLKLVSKNNSVYLMESDFAENSEGGHYYDACATKDFFQTMFFAVSIPSLFKWRINLIENKFLVVPGIELLPTSSSSSSSSSSSQSLSPPTINLFFVTGDNTSNDERPVYMFLDKGSVLDFSKNVMKRQFSSSSSISSSSLPQYNLQLLYRRSNAVTSNAITMNFFIGQSTFNFNNCSNDWHRLLFNYIFLYFDPTQQATGFRDNIPVCSASESYSVTPSMNSASHSDELSLSISETYSIQKDSPSQSSSLSASPSISRPRTPSRTFSKTKPTPSHSISELTQTSSEQPPYVPIGLSPEMVTALTTATQSATAAVSILAASPSAAMSMSRSLAVLDLFGCPPLNPENDERWIDQELIVLYTLFPTVNVGGTPGASARAGVLSFVVVILLAGCGGLFLPSEPATTTTKEANEKNDESTTKIATARGGKIPNVIIFLLFPLAGAWFNTSGMLMATVLWFDVTIGLVSVIFVSTFLIFCARRLLFATMKTKIKVQHSDRSFEKKSVVPYSITKCYIMKPHGVKTDSTEYQIYKFLKSKMGKFLFVGNFCWVKDDAYAKYDDLKRKKEELMMIETAAQKKKDSQHRKNTNNNNTIENKDPFANLDTINENESGSLVLRTSSTLLLEMPKVFIKLIGPERMVVNFSVETNDDEDDDAEELFLPQQKTKWSSSFRERLSPFYFIISVVAAIFCNFLAGVSKGNDNDRSLCEATLIINVIASLFIFGLTIYLRPFIVPVMNYLFIVLDFCTLAVSLSVLIVTKTSPLHLTPEVSTVVMIVQSFAFGTGLAVSLAVLALRVIKVFMFVYSKTIVVTKEQFWAVHDARQKQNKRNNKNGASDDDGKNKSRTKQKVATNEELSNIINNANENINNSTSNEGSGSSAERREAAKKKKIKDNLRLAPLMASSLDDLQHEEEMQLATHHHHHQYSPPAPKRSSKKHRSSSSNHHHHNRTTRDLNIQEALRRDHIEDETPLLKSQHVIKNVEKEKKQRESSEKNKRDSSSSRTQRTTDENNKDTTMNHQRDAARGRGTKNKIKMNDL